MEIGKIRGARGQKNLFPNMMETIKSTEILAKEGFKVMV